MNYAPPYSFDLVDRQVFTGDETAKMMERINWRSFSKPQTDEIAVRRDPGSILKHLQFDIGFLENFRFLGITEKIYSFRKLPKNWDSCGARSPSETAIRAAVSLAGRLRREKLLPTDARVTSDETILLDLRVGISRHFFEVFGNGDIVLVKDAGTAIESVSDIQPEHISEVSRSLQNA